MMKVKKTIGHGFSTYHFMHVEYLFTSESSNNFET